MSGRLFAALAFVGALMGCAGAAPRPSSSEAEEGKRAPEAGPIRLRHQILVRFGQESQVFEGYMVLAKGAFLVKAMAGPGVDLFTVVGDENGTRTTLHLLALEGRLDPAAIGADIARVYLGGCAREPGARHASCLFHEEPMEEDYDAEGRLVARRFPAAHGIGVAVEYLDLASRNGVEVAGRIRLRWGEGGNEMVIVLVDVERMAPSALELLSP